MRFSVKEDLNELTKSLTRLQKKQIPFAASKTLNDIAFQTARKALPQFTDETFEGGATPFTRRGFKYKKSNKRNLFVDIFIDKKQAKYMTFMISGGTRFPEKRAILVSTKKSKLNKYGNLTKATRQELFDNKEKYFQGKPKGRPNAPEGIWERYGRSPRGGLAARSSSGQRIRLVALFTEEAQYRPLFPFGNFVRGVVFARSDGFTAQFRKNLAQALATAR